MFDINNAYVDGDVMVYPEDKINLFDVKPISDITEMDVSPKIDYFEVTPFKDESYLVIDIEATGLDPNNSKVYMIGLKNERGQYRILASQNEAMLIRTAFQIIVKKNPKYVFGYNLQEYDLPFLYERAKRYMMACPFSPSQWFVENDRKRRISTSVIHGRVTEYLPYQFTKNYPDINIIDLYHQIGSWDSVHRKLSKYDLKTVAIEYELRDERRLELGYQEMMDLYRIWISKENDGNTIHCLAPEQESPYPELNKIAKYCAYDLDDTESIAKMIVPSIHYQQLVFEYKPERLATYGNGFKWNSVCKRFYPNSTVVADEKLKYKGGFTYASPGLHKYAGAIDLSSAYPMSQLLQQAYDISKDPNCVVLRLLAKLTIDRLDFKDKGKKDKEAKRLANSLKVIINSCYGFFGTAGLDFNSMAVAAFVAATVHKLVKFIMTRIQYYGGVVMQVDTDGLIFCALGDYSPAEIQQKVQEDIPNGYEIGLDWESDGVYVPANDEGIGLKKNYLVYANGELIKKRGIVNNRSRPKIEREFLVNYVSSHIYKGRDEANNFYEKMKYSIKDRTIDENLLKFNKTIPKNDKKFTEKLKLANKGDRRISYFMGHNANGKEIEVLDGLFNKAYYLEIIRKLKNQVDTSIRLGNLGLK